jgi:hypothetical protein
MSIASFRSLTFANFSAIMFVSLSQLAGASSLYSPTELSSRTTSDIFGMASSGSSLAPSALKSSSDYGTDANFQMLSGLAATPDTGYTAAASVQNDSSPGLYLGNAAFSATSSLYNGSIVESVVEHSVSAEGLRTASELELPASFGQTPTGDFGTGIFGSASGGLPVSNFGTSSPISLSFTTGITSIPVRKTASFQSAVPEPAGVGIAVVGLMLMLGAFYRRRSQTPTA